MPAVEGSRSLCQVDSRSGWTADHTDSEHPPARNQLPVLAGAALVIAVVAQLTQPGSVSELVILAPAVLGFLLRGLVPRMPAEVFAALVIVPVTAAISLDGNLEGTQFLVVVMTLYSAWQVESLVRAASIMVAAVAASVLLAVVLVPEAQILWTPWATGNIVAYAMGRALRRQQVLIEQLRQARQALAEQAVAEERRRIARELHDLAGHTLAAVLLNVTGARHVLRRDVDEAERALLDAEAIGRSSLDQIRAAVVALRTHERGTDRALFSADDIDELIDDYRRAGMAIDATTAGPVESLQGPIGTALHRIVREALANVARHAAGNRVELAVEVDDHRVRLVVADHGRRAAAPNPDEGHFGLVGMRERARALGGRFAAGPTADGWIVEAELPVAVSEPRPVAPS